MIRKNKYSIVFLGTDGSGKSTMIDSIAPILERKYGLHVQYEHLRPNYLPSLAVALGRRTLEEEIKTQAVENPHDVKPSGLFGSLLRLAYYLVDYSVGYFLKISFSKDKIWLFDRYYYDFIVDPKRFRIKLPICILKFCEMFVSKPDLIICLGASSPDIIYQRKPETSLEEVTRQIEYLRLLVQQKNNAVWIDTGGSIEASVDSLLKEIDRLLKR